VGFELRPGVHTYKVQGGFYHLIGGMEPAEGQLPRFLQAYVHDAVNEGLNRQMQNPNLSSAHLMTLRTILERVNPYVNIFICVVDRLAANPTEEVHICITAGHTLGNGDVHHYNAPTTNEVAMIIPNKPGEVGNRDVIVQRRYGGGLQRMNELAPFYDPLQYPLLFLAGEDGWSKILRLHNNQDGARTRVSMAAYYAQRVHFSGELSALHFGGRFFQQYIVDVAAKIEQNTLNFLVLNQAQLHAELYQGVADMVEHDFQLHPTQVGQQIILPASFHGSPRFMMQAYQDAMAIVRSKGIPDVFFTFTCHPNWQEIIVELKPNQTASNRPDLVARVFQMKVKALLKGVVKIGWFSKVIGNIWIREYQKRGLPHIHLLLIFPPEQKVSTTEDIDRLVSAELPLLENTPLFETITKCLLHRPCGQEYPNAPCMVNGLCKKRYPRAFSEETTQGKHDYPVYRRRNYGRTFQKTPNGFAYDNRWVVPHNPYLTKMFNAHINVEVSAGIWSVKYLFKYVYKGPDRVVMVIVGPINEIQQYIDAKYLSAAERVNSLLSFKKHMEWPPVTQLVVHLPGQHNIIFNENEDLVVVAERAAHQKTTLTAYFAYNAQNADGRNVVYADFPADHVWKIRRKVWSARQ
jgi:hypothetical protein